jgi:SAM-dependent methyltransferase
MTSCQGMLDVLRYNARFYVLAAAAALLAAFAAAQAAAPPLRLALGAFAAVTGVFMVTSLAVSHHVYDRSPLRGWSWLAPRLSRAPAGWVVVHAGLDGASAELRRIWPAVAGLVLDVFAADQMSEPAIAQARLRRPTAPSVRARSGALPLAPASMDLAVLFFSAHELRRAADRQQLFGEICRGLAPGGTLVLVEHLRDVPNTLAFGPGALHFLARREWLRVAQAAGLRLRDETPITAFVRAFFFEPAP